VPILEPALIVGCITFIMVFLWINHRV
jgi:hypothetical protein